METGKNNYTAKYDGKKYIVPELGVTSRDGTVWRTASGKLANGKSFKKAEITLVGGPFDGETVA
jgi:sugar lactone lactonase YvrE